MHERAQVEEHVVEGMDGQASGFISVFQSYDRRVHGVGQVTEARPAGFNHFLGALQEEGKDTGFCCQIYFQGYSTVKLSHSRCRRNFTLAMSSGVCPSTSKMSREDGR